VESALKEDERKADDWAAYTRVGEEEDIVPHK
jgi:hypothetical protein